MKRIILMIGLTGIVLGGCLRSSGELGALGVGDAVPDPEFEALQQSSVGSWAELSGRVVLLEFFAHW